MNNRTMIQYFEWELPSNQMLWKIVGDKADKLKDAGFTDIWLPPAYKGMCGREDVGYGVYDMYDLGEFDQKGSIETKYGSKADYIKAIDKLQNAGINVYADIVFNHRMGADGTEEVDAIETSDSNREEKISGNEKITAWTKFEFPGRNGKYSKFKWNKSHFSGCDWDESSKRKSLFLFEGKEWNRETDDEKANYDYLMGADLDMDNEEVCEELLNWGLWYEKITGVNGMRLDAVKHIKASFYRRWIEKMRKETGKKLPCVGEYWSPDLNHLLNYLEEVDDDMMLFDVPLHFNFYHASKSGGAYNMRGIIANSLITAKPKNAVTFVDNHDTQPGQALETFVESWFKPIAYGIILLSEYGLPCVFYGDYYGLGHAGIPSVDAIKTLVRIRNDYAYGEETDYYDDDNVVGFVRKGDSTHKDSGLAVIFSDGSGGSKPMHIGSAFKGARMIDALNKCTETVIVDDKGFGNFRCEGGSISVWIKEEAYLKMQNKLD